jgi:hypothetical protein
MNVFILVGIIIFTIYLFLHIKFLFKINNDYDILQSNNPNKENFEKIMNQKSPSIFTNISNKWNLKDLNKNNIDSYFKYYLSPILLSKKYEILSNTKPKKNKLIMEKNNRHLILQLDGESKFYLFSPNQSKYLYNKKGVSQIDYWNQDLKKFPLLNKAQFIEIILHPHQMIYIPRKWWYVSEHSENSKYIDCNSDSLFSYFIV